MSATKPKLCLFDVNNTLTPSHDVISDEMEELLDELRANDKIQVGIISALDLTSLARQLASSDEQKLHEKFDYVFADNGVTAYGPGELRVENSFYKHVGQKTYNELVSFCLHYIGDLDIFRGHSLVELHAGMMHIIPVGRDPTPKKEQEEQRAKRKKDGKEALTDFEADFHKQDSIHHIRKKFLKALRGKFVTKTKAAKKTASEREAMCILDDDKELIFTAHGPISIDIIPIGWDKSFCMQYLEDKFDEIHFFGDKTQLGGNDHEIAEHDEVFGHRVTDPENAIEIVREVFGLQEKQRIPVSRPASPT